MHIVNTSRFVIGIVFLIVALALFVRARGQRGFRQHRQAAALGLVAAGIFLAIGFGWLDF